MKALILSLILSFSLSSCDWIKSLGPEEPFFCKINDEKFRPQKDDSPIGGWGSKPLKTSIDKEYHWLYIQARNAEKLITVSIKLNSNNEVSEGSYSLTSSNLESNASYYVDYTAAPPILEELKSQEGEFVIEKKEGFNLFGHFQFNCKSAITGKTYTITEGEFNKLSYF